MTVYHGRWDTWLISKNKMDEYFYLMTKNDSAVKYIIAQAKRNAELIKNAPLTKALDEL
jgi:hypothetical protein